MDDPELASVKLEGGGPGIAFFTVNEIPYKLVPVTHEGDAWLVASTLIDQLMEYTAIRTMAREIKDLMRQPDSDLEGPLRFKIDVAIGDLLQMLSD